MSHQRNLIRNAIVSMLMNQTSAGANVFPSRVKPLGEEDLPAICVYTLNDDPKLEITAPRTYLRDLDLMVDATVRQDSSADNALDDLCAQIESIISQDDSLQGTCVLCVIGKTEIIQNVESNKEVLTAKIGFSTQYRSNWPEPIITGPIAPVPLQGVDSTIIVANDPEGSGEIDSTVNLPQS